MDIPEVVRNTRASLALRAPLTKIEGGDVVRFSVFFLLGSLIILYPVFVLGFFAAVATLGFGWLALMHVRRAGLELWQVLLLIALTGYMLLNYGFENLAIHLGGVPIIISYGLMFASLALAVFSCQHLMIRALKEPAMLCLLALLLLALLHLGLDIPSYGLWAVRDSSMFLDGLFLLLGLLSAMRRNSTIPLMKWLMVVFVLNLIYGFSLPWGEKLRAWSPKAGVFHQVTLLGNYGPNAIFLLLGALFCMFLGRYVVRWPRWIMLFLAMAQLFGLAIQQARAMYVGLVVVLIILVLSGETGKSAKLVLVLSSAFVALLFLTTLGGLEISGRVGPVNIAFLKENLKSIFGAEEKLGSAGSSVEGRLDWYDQVFHRIRSNPVLGEGFGQPLINFTNDLTGGAVRQPHNSSISVLARLGAIGFAIWVVFHLCLVKRFIYAFRQRRCCDKQLSDFVLWLFMLYVMFMIGASVEATLEFPSGAVPFYFFVGLALGLIRWQVPQKNKIDGRKAASVRIGETVRL